MRSLAALAWLVAGVSSQGCSPADCCYSSANADRYCSCLGDASACAAVSCMAPPDDFDCDDADGGTSGTAGWDAFLAAALLLERCTIADCCYSAVNEAGHCACQNRPNPDCATVRCAAPPEGFSCQTAYPMQTAAQALLLKLGSEALSC